MKAEFLIVLGIAIVVAILIKHGTGKTTWFKRMVDGNIKKGQEVIRKAKERVLSGELPRDPCDQELGETPPKDPFDPDLKDGDAMELPTLEKKGEGYE